MNLKVNQIGYWFGALISIIATIVFMTGCSASSGDTGGDDSHTVDVSTTSLSFMANGGRKSFTVECSKQWFVNSEEDWHRVFISGNTVWVTVEENITGQIRSGHVKVKCESQEVSIEIFQDKNNNADPDANVEFTLREDYNTLFLPDEVAKGFVSVNDKEKTFVVNPTIAAPSAGDQLIINNLPEYFPEGRIIRITEVTNISQGHKIKYTDIGLADVFKTLKLKETSLDIAEYVNYIENANGDPVDFSKKRTRTETGRYQIEIPQEGWDISSAKVSPKMEIGLLLTTDLDIEDSEIIKFDVAADADIVMDADFKLDNAERDIDFKKKFLMIHFNAIPVGPILITPYIEVTGIFSACGKTSFEASLKYNTRLNSEIHYTNGATLNGSHIITEPEEISRFAQFGTKIEGEAKYGFALNPAIEIYGNALKIESKSTLLWNEKLNIDGEEVKFPGFVAQDTEDVSWAERMMNGDFTTYLSTEGTCNISGNVNPLTYTMPNENYQLGTRKILPTISRYYTADKNGEELEFKTSVSKKAAVYYERLALCMSDGAEYDFRDWNDSAIEQIENGADSVIISANITLNEEGNKPDHIIGEIDGKKFYICKF